MTHYIFILAAESAESASLFDFGATLPVMAVQFLLLVVILNAIFFKPLTKAISDRNEYIRGNIAEAKERLEKAKSLAQSYEQELAATRKQTQEIIASAQTEANKIRSQRIAEAMAESQKKVDAVRAEIEQQKKEASASLEAQVNVLSRQILDKLLGNLVHS